MAVAAAVAGGSGAVKRVGYEGRDGAENKGWEIEDARGEDLGFSGREPGVVRSEDGEERVRVDLEVLEGVASLVEPKPGLLPLLLLGRGFDGRDVGLGFGSQVGFGGGLLDGVGGSGEHLDDLLEGESVGLDEGRRVRAARFGSGHGFRSLRQRRRQLLRLDSIVAAGVGSVSGRRRKERGAGIGLLVPRGYGFHG